MCFKPFDHGRAAVAGRPSRWRLLPLLAVLLSLMACAGKPLVPWSANLQPLPPDRSDWTDERGSFRELFCAVNQAHGPDLPDPMSCEEALIRVGVEPAAGDLRLPPLGPAAGDLLFLMVPGIGWECVSAFLEIDYSAPNHVANFGYDVRLITVDALSGSQNNAAQINDYILGLPPEDRTRPIVLIGYSKGMPDILEFLAGYPETVTSVRAVVSYAGAVFGSMLAEDIKQSTIDMLRFLPGADCEKGDSRSRQSLLPATRQSWLEQHPLPGHVQGYTIASFPTPERISRGLRHSWKKLGHEQDQRNDSQLVFYDQILPGSRLLAFANADHWAMAVPVARHKRFLVAVTANENNYPREVMLEALVRFLEWDLNGRSP